MICLFTFIDFKLHSIKRFWFPECTTVAGGTAHRGLRAGERGGPILSGHHGPVLRSSGGWQPVEVFRQGAYQPARQVRDRHRHGNRGREDVIPNPHPSFKIFQFKQKMKSF